ncbi:DUF6454 family protein [Knoellia sp. S7-12]|uniref:DUF6454 family protein n=1 Tax=Knoellia sp. S7-12 TaxID=3126698 RepID=UPI0033686A0B
MRTTQLIGGLASAVLLVAAPAAGVVTKQNSNQSATAPTERAGAGTQKSGADGIRTVTRTTARDEDVVGALKNITRGTAWKKTGTLDLAFETFHPQGLEVTEDRIYLSSVEILEPTVRYPSPIEGYDRSPGKGIGHLFVLDRQGNLLKDIVLGEGNSYHPGGIDVDDEKVWVPVAEYRPNSHAIIYSIDRDSLAVTKEFEEDDHVGGIVHDRASNKLVGNTWGSRRFFEWTTKGREVDRWLNPDHMLDYQDCEYAGEGHAICSGVTGLPAQPGAVTGYELGGLALVSLKTGQLEHEVPVQLWSTAGHVITRNPVDLDAVGSHVTLFAAPDDGEEIAGTQLFTYEADVTPLK